jgi:hypothetical protein
VSSTQRPTQRPSRGYVGCFVSTYPPCCVGFLAGVYETACPCVPTGIRNQEFPQGFYSGMGHVRSGSGTPGSRNSRGGYPGSGTAQYTQGGSTVHGKKNSGANRDAAEERSVPCPHNPRNLWQIFNGIEQNEKMKSCGQKYWDFTPSKILEHFGLQSTRETAAKSVTGARVSSSC